MGEPINLNDIEVGTVFVGSIGGIYKQTYEWLRTSTTAVCVGMGCYDGLKLGMNTTFPLDTLVYYFKELIIFDTQDIEEEDEYDDEDDYEEEEYV